VTGPTGSGKTTTLYATLNHVKSPEVKIITAEDPVEYQLHGIKQIQVDNKVNLTFAAALRSMLRLDPDIIMVGEMRDHETAEIGIQAALTGHLVFSTLHTNDAPTAITRLVEMGIAPYLVASSVVAVLAQRLVRKLCANCKQQDAHGHWQALGCSQCEGSGYKGRLGIYELMIINDAIRELIVESKDATVIAAEARKHGLVTLADDGQAKIAQGLTSADEIRRVAG
jgi:general secretion pathway protein E